jgi:DNA-binding transcriptional LysR family regulator
MDLVGNLRSFLRVSETGSFSAVAAERGVTQPAISRQVSALEEYLGTRLVLRSTQAVTLTDEGRNLLVSAQGIIDAADSLLEIAKHRRGKPVGHVRIAVSVPLGLYLSKYITQLLDQHQELSVELVLRDRYGNLMEDGLDAEVRVGERPDSTLISRRVGSTNQWVVASPDVWWFIDPTSEKNEISVNVRGRFSANNAAAVHRAAVAGQGIACLSHLIVGEDVKAGRLQQLMPDFRPRRSPIYVDYPTRRSLPPRVRAVVDFLHQIAKDDPLLRP